MRFPLRWKILLITLIAPITLAMAVVFVVHRNVAVHVDASSIHETLEQSQTVFEGILAERAHTLVGGAQVVAEDPRFFSLLMLGISQRDRRFSATVRGMANDFNRITRTDLFEVLDRQGHVLASVGSGHSTPIGRAYVLREALAGRAVSGVLVEPDAHFQVAAVPVRGDGRSLGVLLLGASIGGSLARELHEQMHCDVTFLNGHAITGSTLPEGAPRVALQAALDRIALNPRANLLRIGALHIGSGREDRLTMFRRMPGTAASQEQYYVLQRSFDPEVAFQRSMQQDMIGLAALALILAIVSALLFSGTIVGPVARLVRGAREMEAGNYEHPIHVQTGDELGYLADQFTRMRQRERAYVESLEAAARLKSEFISIASHELRTPLSGLTGYHDLLASGDLGPVSDRQRRAFEAMREHLGRLTQVAESATRVAQVHGERLSLDRQPCDIEPIVRRAIASARSIGQGRTVELKARVEPLEEPAWLDAQAVQQALEQLVTNGIRFTPDGGHVDVHVWADDTWVHFDVTDSGVGMDAVQLDTLRQQGIGARDPRHHQSGSGLAFGSSGLGLGLALARGIVEAHDGRLEIESQLGAGSTFSLLLPLRAEARRAA